jgi:hypothetical protein
MARDSSLPFCLFITSGAEDLTAAEGDEIVSDSENTTLIEVSTSTGSLFNKYGLYRQVVTASSAACRNKGGPSTTRRFSIVPVFEIVACSTTVPETRAALAIMG